MASRRLLSLPRRPMSASSSQNSLESDTTDFERELYAIVGKSRNSVNEISKFEQQYLKFVENQSTGSGQWEVYPADNQEIENGEEQDIDNKSEAILDEELKSLADSLQSQNISVAFASRLSNEKKIEEYKEIFSFLDQDGSGALSKNELKKGLSCVGHDLTNEEFKGIMKEMGKDGQEGEDEEGLLNKELNEAEFVEMMGMLESKSFEGGMTEDECVNVIMEKFDKDGSGCLSMEEFGNYLKSNGDDPLTDEEVSEFFSEFDKDADGSLTSEELKTLMQKLRATHEAEA